MDVDELLARYAAVTQEEEAELLTRLIEDGWDAGCWIRPAPELILTATQEEVADFLERIRGRAGIKRAAVEDDPFPNGRPHEPIDGEEPCYVVLTMRCDIANPFKNEPLVELAPARICTDKGRIKTAWKNSPRDFPVD